MTADIVDWMGTTGTQGVCQHCAEETLHVLSNDSEVVLTVLEDFNLRYDPLHSWCVKRRPHPPLVFLRPKVPCPSSLKGYGHKDKS
jgi:phosphatidylinositol kinase/protein kinase (PI-3  family)